MKRGLLCVASAIFVLAGFAPGNASAAFTPIQCSICPTTTTIDWSYNTSEMPQDPNCLPGTGPCPHYTNWLDQTRYITGNQYIRQIGFYYPYVITEQCCDKISYGQYDGALSTLSGNLSQAWHDFSVSTSLQKKPWSLEFSY